MTDYARGYIKPDEQSWDFYGVPEWDDRKQLAELWQQHAPLPDIGLREGIYDALLAVAYWGYERGRAANDPESDLHDALHPEEHARGYINLKEAQ